MRCASKKLTFSLTVKGTLLWSFGNNYQFQTKCLRSQRFVRFKPSWSDWFILILWETNLSFLMRSHQWCQVSSHNCVWHRDQPANIRRRLNRLKIRYTDLEDLSYRPLTDLAQSTRSYIKYRRDSLSFLFAMNPPKSTQHFLTASSFTPCCILIICEMICSCVWAQSRELKHIRDVDRVGVDLSLSG